MRVFVTGATGFVGSAVVQELINAGHQVLGLARSEENAKSLIAAGAKAHRGDLEDLDSLRSGVAASDGVIHTGFVHDFSRFKECCEIDRLAINAMGEALAGSDRPLIITSGIGILRIPDRLATEEDIPAASSPNPRIASELAANALAEKGVRVAILRLPPTVHGAGDHGFVPILIGIAREKGISVYKEEGANSWPAVHRKDAAKLYRLALEKAPAGIVRYHAVAEEGIAFREIAEEIGKGLNVPAVSKSVEEANEHFSWFAHFAGMDCAASSQQTKAILGWSPEQPGLIEDLDKGGYFKI
ncbi:SDR family oxidoreductase [Dyadobacter subterraneus]|uniref:SDR family oxidoreductase n=1 Tax=Dyadobacter subterraneus TaxID=2773304 RepID=A0ABR9W8Y6_9BACT|nr:SDR family oxidoreductase [Dyadobacter subterraneus]MBE9461401.1 SDR family oxidoreductase [Dyadobacter subterraneus]